MLSAEYQALVDEVHVVTDLKTSIGHGFGALNQVIAQQSGKIAALEKTLADIGGVPPEVTEGLQAVKDSTAQLIAFVDAVKSAIPANTDLAGQTHDDGTPQPVLGQASVGTASAGTDTGPTEGQAAQQVDLNAPADPQNPNAELTENDPSVKDPTTLN